MSPSVVQQHPDNQFSIQKRAGHFDKKYNCGDTLQSPSSLINNMKVVISPSSLMKNITVVMPRSGTL